jgi:nicotinate-nucleotide pyrophosphorylase (carboxylating)
MSDRFDFFPGAMARISRGVTFDRMRELAGTGDDRICVGTLNRNMKAADFPTRFKEI